MTWTTATFAAAAHAFRQGRALMTPSFASRPLSATTDLAVEAQQVPVTLLSGFLGAGKTTLLQQLLKSAQENGLKLGVVVNDVATVNVDSKLVRSPFEDESGAVRARPDEGEAEFVELGDGCICCSISNELFTTLAQLTAASQMRGFAYDHIVVEATGVAEPRSIRDLFQDAEAEGMPLLDALRLDTLVTVVDSEAFLSAYSETRAVAERPDLAAPPNDLTAILLSRFDGSLQRSVVDLLLEQVEVADVILLNKADLLEEDQLQRLEAIISSLNSKASVWRSKFGDTPMESVLAFAGAAGAVTSGPVDEHKIAVKASLENAINKGAQYRNSRTELHENEHDHSHGHAHSHEHVHSHEHTHASDHDHDQPRSSSHTQPSSVTSARQRFGIDSFVYTRRRPFVPSRLERVLRFLPADTSSLFGQGSQQEHEDDELSDSLKVLLRSKGFM